ncbi:MAG TPA: PilZ domain-containing protein [Pyrinomonadaceae bacterium]|jgi:hypothetical protein|nr:PilZ domain-containing protein [Pyrinomonadaceae bacterium]
MKTEDSATPEKKAKRLRPPMHCYWGATEVCPRNGKITTLSSDGCFIKTKAEASDEQFFFLNCWLPTGRWMMLRGKVNYRLPKIGFGLSFTDLTDIEREMLSMLLEFYAEDALSATV